jgi:hypothetical protein
VKSREAGLIVSKAVILAVAVDTGGARELLGMAVNPSEAQTFWSEYQRSLTCRGLCGVKLAISDSNEGLKAAAAKVLGATCLRGAAARPEHRTFKIVLHGKDQSASTYPARPRAKIWLSFPLNRPSYCVQARSRNACTWTTSVQSGSPCGSLILSLGQEDAHQGPSQRTPYVV